MIDLTNDSKKIFVKINGEEYEVAERTAEIDEKLQAHNNNLDNMTSYEASYNLVKILLGDESAKKIFPNGKKENLTWMYRVAKAVDEAYQAEYQELRDAEYEESLKKMDNLVQRTKPVIDMIERNNNRRRNR